MKIDDLYLNVEETKWSVAGTSPEAIEEDLDLPGEDGKTTSGDQAPGDVSIDGEPSEGVNDNRNMLMHVPDQSNRARSPPDVESCRQITNVEPANEQQVSMGQCNTRRLERTFDGHLSHPLGPLSPYPVPIPTPVVRCSSCTRKVPIHDDDLQFFINTYERTPLEEEIQLNKYEIEDLPSCIESLDDRGERHTHADVTESHRDVLTQSVQCTATETPLDIEPLTYNDTIERPDADLWLAAMSAELNTFKEIGLYKEVESLSNCKIINSKWVFKIKCRPNGEIDKYKACLVVKGYTQIEGLNYTDMFTPVTKFTTICSLLVLVAHHNLEGHQVDVKAAFLNSELEEEIYLHPLPGFCDNPKVVWCLQHALYSLKQASKAWYDTL